VTVEVREPEPLVLASPGGFSFAALRLTLRVDTGTDGNLAPTAPPLLPREMKVKSRVRSVTYATVAPARPRPGRDQEKSMDQAPACAPVVATLNKFEERHVARVALDAWRPPPPPGPGGDGGGGGGAGRQHVMETTVLVPVTTAALAAPTFYSPWVARRYGVALRVDVKGAGGRGVSLRLSVPLQVVYPAAPSPAASVAGSARERLDGELPVYIP
jgi:hypothetical protein